MRPRGERGIADQAEPPERHAWALDVDDGLEKRRLGLRYDIGDRAGQRGAIRMKRVGERLADGARWKRNRPADARPVGHQRIQLRALGDIAVPDEVHQPPSRLHAAVDARDRIDEDVAVRHDVIGDCVVQRSKRFRVELGLGNRAAPGDIARVDRLGVGQ